jgi:alpha-amylase
LTDIVLVFEVHQPHRINKSFFWESKMFKRVEKKEYFDYYFDSAENREVFERACTKCYFPSNSILLELIDRYKGEKKKPKFSFSLSGVFLEQCEMFNKDLLETFKQLAETGQVEFLSQTYYHSLASLYPEREEFIEQVKMHQQVMKDLLGYKSTVFENTELLYNNAVARAVESLGYEAIFTEGVERILHGKSPNYLYSPKDLKRIKILLRNYKLTDDIGFRFSARWWNEWPLTADKYASWLAATPGDCINIFPDYETFGEHHWPETGIHDFLRHLTPEILKWWNLHMATPSEVADKYASKGEIDVPELGGTVSWADLERDASCWLGNTMQWAYYTTLRRLEPLVKETEDREFLKTWSPRRSSLLLQPLQHPNGRFRNRTSGNTGLREQSKTRRDSCGRTVPLLHRHRRKVLHRNKGLEPKRLRKSHSNSKRQIRGISQQPRRLRTVG